MKPQPDKAHSVKVHFSKTQGKPFLYISGKWLTEAGFPDGTQTLIESGNIAGKPCLLITIITPPPTPT